MPKHFYVSVLLNKVSGGNLLCSSFSGVTFKRKYFKLSSFYQVFISVVRTNKFPVVRNFVFCNQQILSFHTLSFNKFSYLCLLYVPELHIAPKSHKLKSWIQLKTDSFQKNPLFCFLDPLSIFSMPYIWNKNRHSQSFLYFFHTFALLFTTLLNSLDLNNKNLIFTRLGKLR